MMSQLGKQTIVIHIFPNPHEVKAMKLGHLIEYNMEICFLKNYIQNVVEKHSQTLFQKIEIEHISESIV